MKEKVKETEKEPQQEQPEQETVPMNRAERRHMAKHGGSTDSLHDFRGQQAQRNSPGHTPGPAGPMKRGALHRKTGS